MNRRIDTSVSVSFGVTLIRRRHKLAFKEQAETAEPAELYAT